jgi:Uncharacterized protein conserved in bacteria
MHRYSFHIGDYIAHTRHLGPMEDLAYRRMLDLYYLHERPLGACAEDIAECIGLPNAVDAVETVLTLFFFRGPEGGHHNKRCDREIEEYQRIVARNRDNGKLGGRPGNPSGFQTNNPNGSIPLPSSLLPSAGKEQQLAALAEFERFLEVYGKRTDKMRAFKAWCKLRPAPELVEIMLERAAAYRDATPDKQFRKSPVTWLNGRCWEDEIVQPSNGKPVKPVEHMRNHPLGSSACFCVECVAFRSKQKQVAQ